MAYPCNYCGSCPIWLAAFEIPELDTEDKLIRACRDRGCSLCEMEVGEEDVNGERGQRFSQA